MSHWFIIELHNSNATIIMQQFLSGQTQKVTEYDEQLVRRLIEKITVCDEWVTVEFKSGTSVKVRR